MTLEAIGVFREGFGSLRGCLVEGDPQSEKRARRTKQRAVAVSIGVQTLALVALVLFPLLSKGERVCFQYVPIPPYPHMRGQQAQARPRGPRTIPLSRFWVPNRIPPTIPPSDVTRSSDPVGPDDENIPGLRSGPGVDNSFAIAVRRPDVPAVEPPQEGKKPYVVSEFQQMAQLCNRVEPIYPQLAIQTHHEGRVELHAMISPEGKIESLEVLSGDPFFIQSALSAVRQWHYRPTILNGHAVEIDTHITVVYTLSH
jgi:protein TonB